MKTVRALLFFAVIMLPFVATAAGASRQSGASRTYLPLIARPVGGAVAAAEREALVTFYEARSKHDSRTAILPEKTETVK